MVPSRSSTEGQEKQTALLQGGPLHGQTLGIRYIGHRIVFGANGPKGGHYEIAGPLGDGLVYAWREESA